MAHGRKARKRALDILFEAEQRGLDPLTALRDAARTGPTRRSTSTPSRWSRASSRTATRIDELLDDLLRGWTLDRMPAVDRACCGSAPTSCSGATTSPTPSRSTRPSSWPRELSTDESPAFVNGLLGRTLRTQAVAGARSRSDPWSCEGGASRIPSRHSHDRRSVRRNHRGPCLGTCSFGSLEITTASFRHGG